MALTDGLKLPIPDLTESADGPDAFSDALNAIEDYLYDRILPTGVTRVPKYYWGSGTSFPTGALLRASDSYFHTGLGCLMSYNGTAWRQAEIPTVATIAARDAISTNYSSLLHERFSVYVTEIGDLSIWTSGAWSGTGSAILTSSQPAASVAGSTLVGPGTLAIAGQKGNIVALPTPTAADRIVVKRPGLYLFHWRYTTGATAPSGTLTFWITSATGTPASRVAHLNGADVVGAGSALLNITAADTVVIFQAYTTHTGSTSSASEIRVSRLGPSV